MPERMAEFQGFAQRRQTVKLLLEKLRRREEKKRGYLIAFEGPDGAGKSTQCQLFCNWLKNEGHKVVITKWSSSPLIKPLIKARKAARSFSPEEFCLLHAADFRHRLETEILPALWKGKIVLADRYLYTALAGDAARGMELSWLLDVYSPLLWPDVVYYLSVSPETSGRRISAKRPPKFYKAGQDITRMEDPVASHRQFVSRVIQEYQALAVIFEFVTVDAEKSIYEQHRLLRELFEQRRRRPWAEWNVEVMLDWLVDKKRKTEAQLGS